MADPKVKETETQKKISHSNGNEKTKSKAKAKEKSKSKPQQITPSNMKLKAQNGSWKPMDLLWEESSGAIAPDFRYAKKFHLYTKGNKVFLFRFILKNGKKVLEESSEIKSTVYEKWMNKLHKIGIHMMPYEEMPEDTITGISYNSVTFSLGSIKSKFYYRLDDINQEGWEQKKEIINLIERMKP